MKLSILTFSFVLALAGCGSNNPVNPTLGFGQNGNIWGNGSGWNPQWSQPQFPQGGGQVIQQRPIYDQNGQFAGYRSAFNVLPQVTQNIQRGNPGKLSVGGVKAGDRMYINPNGLFATVQMAYCDGGVMDKTFQVNTRRPIGFQVTFNGAPVPSSSFTAPSDGAFEITLSVDQTSVNCGWLYKNREADQVIFNVYSYNGIILDTCVNAQNARISCPN